MIPVAWAKLLLDLSERNPSRFLAWPSTSNVAGGCSYWQSVPKKALEWIMNSDVPLWPVHGSSPPNYRRLTEILVAPPTVSLELLDALTSIGLVISQPPREIYDLACEAQCHHLLTPELAHAAILVCLYVSCAPLLLTDQILSNTEVGDICGSQQKGASPFVGLSPFHRQGWEYCWHPTH